MQAQGTTFDRLDDEPELQPSGAAPVMVRATAAEAAGAAARVAGLTVLERAVKQLVRAGRPVVIASDGRCPLPPLPPGAPVEVRPVGAGGIDELARSLSPPPLAVVGADVVRPGKGDLDGGIQVTDAASRRRAEDAIFAELLRGDLGLVARHLNKPLSFRITRYILCRLPVTPNQVTVGAGLIGLVGCALVASGQLGLIAAGLLLAHVQSVLDGCDGELARVRFQQSPVGEWLDTIVDDGLNLALMIALGIGLADLVPTAPIAFVAAGMMLVYNAVAYRELHRQGEGGEVLKVRWWINRGAELKDVVGGGGRRSPAQLFMQIGRRDFFVLAWLGFALVGPPLLVLVPIYAFFVALPSFGVAIGQLVVGKRA
jgi:phosphatidylglycerophosphate synthase